MHGLPEGWIWVVIQYNLAWIVQINFQQTRNSQIITTFCRIYMLHTHTHTYPFNGPFSGLPGWAGTRKVKAIWISLKQDTVSGSGISWAICKSASRSRQITMPLPHHSVFYRPDALPATQPTASKHWRHCGIYMLWVANSITCYCCSLQGNIHTLYSSCPRTNSLWARCDFVA